MPIDPVTIPVFMKILDFFFDQGGKILERRRKRQDKESENDKVTNAPASGDTESEQIESTITSKESALQQKILDQRIKSNQKRIEHLLEIKDVYINRYDLARKKMSVLGEIDTPYKILHEIDECEREIAKIMEETKILLSDIFEKSIDSIELNAYRIHG